MTSTLQRDPAQGAAADIAGLSTADLIAHLISRYHDTHRREFAEAVAMARKVETTHVDDEDCPKGLADHLAVMADRLEGHQAKEERILFPRLIAGGEGPPSPAMMILRMSAEHLDVWEELDQLRRLSADFTAPANACRTWARLIAATRKLHDDLIEHMRLEDEVLFVRFI